MTYQEIIKAISQRLGCANESLPVDEQNSLIELIRQQQQDRRQAELTPAELAQRAEKVFGSISDFIQAGIKAVDDSKFKSLPSQFPTSLTNVD